jgi:tetratricopeptide (TPR) repeat protein
MYGYYYHCEQYILVLIIQKQFEKAQELLDLVFEPCIKNKVDIYATRGAMSYVKLYLSNGDLKSALKYLNIAKVINEKTFYLPFDVQLRVLENIYFFLKEDFDFAYQLANRNIKFIRSQEENPVLGDYILIWKMLVNLINKILKEEPISKELISENKKLHELYSNLYCNLIQLLLEKTKL